MKSIKVKSYNKLIEDIKLDGDTTSWNGKLKKRITDAIRLAKECRSAANIAREDGKDEDAEWLDKRAEDYEQAAKNWNQDLLDNEDDADSDSSNQDNNGESKKEETAEDAANRAQNAANRAQADAEAANKAAEEAKAKAEDAAKDEDKKTAEEAKQQAKDAAEAAQKSTEAAKQAQEAADKAKDAAKDGKEAEAKDAANKAEQAEQEAKEAAKQAMGKQDNKDESGSDDKSDNKDTDEKNKDSDSDKDSKSDKDSNRDDNSDAQNGNGGQENKDQKSGQSQDNDPDDSDSDSDSESNSDDNSSKDDKGQKGKSGKSGSNQDQNDDDDSDDSDDQDDDTPIKDPFVDDEDIPQLPTPGQQNGKQPRDPTVDEIIKHLKALDGEAKRGAIDGLKDLLGKKNESLDEAFKKSIREFSDDEWDQLSDETIDRIEKIKHLDTIDNIEGIKATVKGWSNNEIARQELSDEENQNIQKDILKRRAREKELDKYSNIETLKDFELDFENCIRDQVEMVMQEYQSYDEINPEYEDEDVIMKADVARMLPSESIPTVAMFFDQSVSFHDYHIQKGNKAVASVKQKYVDTGLCKMDLYYFGDNVTNNVNNVRRNGTRAWPYIIQTIKEGNYKNVVIMSDEDIAQQNNHGESWTVEGCVWWIWKEGKRADKCTQELRGMQHNFECEIY